MTARLYATKKMMLADARARLAAAVTGIATADTPSAKKFFMRLARRERQCVRHLEASR